MPCEHRMRRLVEFADTDMAGIMHFANYFRFMEAAEHAFFRSLGLAVHTSNADGSMEGWVRVSAACDYFAPLHYQDEVELRLSVREKREKSITYEIEFTRIEATGPEPLEPAARGRVTVVFVRKGPRDERLRAAPMPPNVDALITVAPGARQEGR
jgi:acyl-CoA thioester hydrolase